MNALADAFDSSQKKVSFCRLCKKNPAESVTLYTKSGIEIVASDLVCSQCASGQETPTKKKSEMPLLKPLQNCDAVFQTKSQEKLPQVPPRSVKKAQAIASNSSLLGITDVVPPASTAEPLTRSQIYRQQTKAILIKNLIIQRTMRKTNICLGLVVIVIVILMALLGSISGGRETRCPQGWPSRSDIDNCDEDILLSKISQALQSNSLDPTPSNLLTQRVAVNAEAESMVKSSTKFATSLLLWPSNAQKKMINSQQLVCNSDAVINKCPQNEWSMAPETFKLFPSEIAAKNFTEFNFPVLGIIKVGNEVTYFYHNDRMTCSAVGYPRASFSSSNLCYVML